MTFTRSPVGHDDRDVGAWIENIRTTSSHDVERHRNRLAILEERGGISPAQASRIRSAIESQRATQLVRGQSVPAPDNELSESTQLTDTDSELQRIMRAQNWRRH